MNLSVGIIGLPNVGKSTLFNAIMQRQEALAANYPFATIEPNVGVVDVPDDILDRLNELFKAEKKTPAMVKFYDIAGLVEGAHKGEGLGNKFLSHIREVNAVVHVLRDFSDENVIRAGAVNPEHDKEIIKTELALADIQTIDNRLVRCGKNMELANFLTEVKNKVEKFEEIDFEKYTDEQKEELKSMNLFHFKPVIYLINTDEDKLKPQTDHTIYLCAKTESELAGFSTAEKSDYLKSLGQEFSGLDLLIKKCFTLLGLQAFYTAGVQEVRAWTIKKGAKAPQAAGEIHTDFEKGFIKAEVIKAEDLLSCGGWKEGKEKGLVRLEGKEYVMQENDTVIFKFNV